MGTVRLAPGLGPRLCWRRAQTAGEKQPRGPRSPQARQSVRTALVFQVFFFFFFLYFSLPSIPQMKPGRNGQESWKGKAAKPLAAQWHFFFGFQYHLSREDAWPYHKGASIEYGGTCRADRSPLLPFRNIQGRSDHTPPSPLTHSGQQEFMLRCRNVNL